MNQQYEGVIFFIFHDKNGYANAPRCCVILIIGVLLTCLAEFRKSDFTFLHTKLENSSWNFFKNVPLATKMDTNMSQKIFLIFIYDIRFKVVMRRMFREIQQ